MIGAYSIPSMLLRDITSSLYSDVEPTHCCVISDCHRLNFSLQVLYSGSEHPNWDSAEVTGFELETRESLDTKVSLVSRWDRKYQSH